MTIDPQRPVIHGLFRPEQRRGWYLAGINVLADSNLANIVAALKRFNHREEAWHGVDVVVRIDVADRDPVGEETLDLRAQLLVSGAKQSGLPNVAQDPAMEPSIRVGEQPSHLAVAERLKLG